MKISTQTCYYSDTFCDLGVDVNSDGTVTLWGFDNHPGIGVADLRKLALLLEHVANQHDISLFANGEDDEDGGGGEEHGLVFIVTRNGDVDPRQMSLF